jgi:hypothetical protein
VIVPSPLPLLVDRDERLRHRDANLDNWRLGDQWFDINRAKHADRETARDRTWASVGQHHLGRQKATPSTRHQHRAERDRLQQRRARPE